MSFTPQRTVLATALIAAMLSLGACSSDSDDDPVRAGAAGAGTSAGPLDVVGDAEGGDAGVPSVGTGAPATGSGSGNGSTVGGGAAPGLVDTDTGAGSEGEPVGGTTTDPIDDGGDSAQTVQVTDAALPGDVATRLERALSLFRGGPIEIAAAIVERFDDAGSGVVESGRAPADPAFGNATGEAIEYRCADGGTASTRDTIDGTGVLRERDVTFSSCRVGAYDVTGSARRGAGDVPADIALPAPFTAADLEPFYPQLGLSIVDSRDGSEIVLARDAQSFTNFSERSSEVGLLNRNWAASGEPARLVGPARRTTLADIAVGIAYRDDGTGQIGTVDQFGEVRLSGTGADGLRSVAVVDSLERDVADARYTAGTMEIAGDGFGYLLDAGNGDPASFQLTVEADGATTAYTVPWSERFDLDAFLPRSVDLGFGG